MKKIEIGLDLTKETKKVDLIIQGNPNPDMDKIKESSKNYLDCQSSTKEKMRQLKEIFKKYNINGDVDIK